MWEIEGTGEFEDWYLALDAADQAKVDAAVDLLEQHGPALGRPVVAEVAGSRLHNLKELRAKSIRILFVFDLRRTAILLLGADKAEHGWKQWYGEAIREAERLYDTYLGELRKEGLIK
jgi:hypothetical protein